MKHTFTDDAGVKRQFEIDENPNINEIEQVEREHVMFDLGRVNDTATGPGPGSPGPGSPGPGSPGPGSPGPGSPGP